VIGRLPRPCHSRRFVNIIIVVILDDIETKQLQWCGHVQRMEEGRLPTEVQGKVAVVLAEIRTLKRMPK